MSRCHSSPSQILDLKKQAEQGSPGSTFAAGTRGLTVDANWQYEHDPADSAYETGTHAPSLDPSKPVVHGPADSTYASGNLGKPGPYTAHTIYSASETSTLPPLKERHFIADLAEELFNKIKSSALGRADLERISEKLPRLLRSFALRIGYKAQTGMHRDVSYFVHKYRGRIQGTFEDMLPLREGTLDASNSDVDKKEMSQFVMGRFLKDPEFNGLYFGQDNNGSDDQDQHKDQNEAEDWFVHEIELSTDAELYRNFILTTPAYTWLIKSLQREVTITRADPDMMEIIGNKIFGALPSYRKVSRKVSSPEYKATFEVDWDPLAFVKEQQYTVSPEIALERAITLTGSANDAQAVTTANYLFQTWPATGKQVMRLVMDVVRNSIDHHHICILPDGTAIDARINGHKFIVTTTGTGDSVAEVGQQFAWLGAALRSSPFEARVTLCSPVIQIGPSEDTASPLDARGKTLAMGNIHCEIKFEMEECPTNTLGRPGQCWHNMVGNPVVVGGYPILAKHERGLGVEMPLNMIARLGGSQRVTEFDGKVYLKGFSTMLIATRIAKDLLIWHYFFNCDKKRISYLDHTLQSVEHISMLQLHKSRHVVGWSSECMYYAGALDAGYKITATSLPQPHAGCLLEKASISVGKIVTGGMTFAVGVKDVPLHLTRKGYIHKLRWITTKHVVLWDEGDKRGWLVNGISALLHLVRASLEEYRTDDFSDSFLFDQSKMKDAAEHEPNSAAKVLSNKHNREIIINEGEGEEFEEEEIKQMGADTEASSCWKKRRGFYRFEDLVEERYNTLEQAMDYQRLALGQNGVKLKGRLRKHLDGWDFAELATDHDPYPRVATLQALGYGWVDFVHSIEAITLLGRGFGDIIRPMKFDGMCPNWRGLPTEKYYLGASVYDLKKIISKFGDMDANPVRLCRDLLWHCPGEFIAPCWCQKHTIGQIIRKTFRQHHDPVQVLYPKRSRLILPIRGPDKLGDGGAIVFGHSIEWGYRWRDNTDEDLEIGDPPPSSSAPELVGMTAGPGFNSGSYSTSGSFQSHESVGAAMMRSLPLHQSPSAQSAQSTPVESITESTQEFNSKLLEQGFPSPESSQEAKPAGKRSRTPGLLEPVHETAESSSGREPEGKRPRTLRHEPRRL